MILNLDLNVIVQSALVFTLIGIGGAFWRMTIMIAVVAKELTDHKDNDATTHETLRADIRELRARPGHTTSGNGKWPS